MKLSKLPLNLAIAAAMGVGATGVYAEGSDNVDIDKDIDLTIDVEHRGYIQTLGLVLVDATATAISDVEQESAGNRVENGLDTNNNANASGNALRDASGNIGLNVAAGDNNVQQNSTAISRIESSATAVNVEAGYSDNISESAFTSYALDNEAQSQVDASSSNSGSAAFSASESQASSFTDGTYDHTQTEEHDSSVALDGTLGAGDNEANAGYVAGNGAVESKALDLPTGEDADMEHGHQQGRFALQGAGGDYQGEYTAEDEVATTSDTTVTADVAAAQSQSASAGYSEEWSESESSSASTSYDEDVDSGSTYNREYQEFANVDANLVFGAALDAETFSKQNASGNITYNYGTTNNARLNGNVGQNASGNIGVNVAAGSSNVQANQLAIASGTGAVMATATAASSQKAAGNYTDNAADPVTETLSASISLSQTGEATGSYSGLSDQANDLYPDIWPGEEGQPHDPHPTSDGFWGHVDLDSNNQGAEHAPENHPAHDPDGSLLFNEAGELALSGIELDGSAQIVTTRYVGHTNNAVIDGNALRGATGNIGVNVAAGTNNLQGNSLAISRAVNLNGGGNGGE